MVAMVVVFFKMDSFRPSRPINIHQGYPNA